MNQHHRVEFGQYLKSLREEKGYSSQRILASKIGVSNSTLAKIERGAHEASDETLRKLADVLGVEFLDLVEKQIAGNTADIDLIFEKIKRLQKHQIDIVSNMVDEFLRLGGRA